MCRGRGQLLVPFLVAAATVASAIGVDAEGIESALVEDDECSASNVEAGACDLTMLQMRAKAASDAVERQEDQAESEEVLEYHSEDSMEYEDGENSTGNYMTLYHQTSESAGKSILRTGFRPGSSGICGGAIYFSPSPKDTDNKAIGGRGFMIQATVDMGRMKTMPAMCDKSMTGSKLKSMGYDSITVDRGGVFECWFMAHCREYIIYDKRRVKHMKGYPYSTWQAWNPWASAWKPPWQANAATDDTKAPGGEAKAAQADAATDDTKAPGGEAKVVEAPVPPAKK